VSKPECGCAGNPSGRKNLVAALKMLIIGVEGILHKMHVYILFMDVYILFISIYICTRVCMYICAGNPSGRKNLVAALIIKIKKIT
jgi:hypothetical protein